MNQFQRFFFVVALIGGLIFYVAGVVLMTPPLTAHLFAKEQATVSAATVETRQANPAALPVIDVTTASGEAELLYGHHWTDADDASAVLADFPMGETVKVVRYDGKLWRGMSGLRDIILLILSALGAFVTLFGLWMVWKVRGDFQPKS